MAEGILILKTTPGRQRVASTAIAIGSYEALFLYQLSPAIEDFDGLKIAPTPLADLVAIIGQKTVDRYIKEPEAAAFESGDGAWEFVAGSRATKRDSEEDPIRLETLVEMVARLKAEWAGAKARAVAEWTDAYQYTGRRLAP